eukprot:scaffold18608_cov97-Isochrysis_galbana.AAC.1
MAHPQNRMPRESRASPEHRPRPPQNSHLVGDGSLGGLDPLPCRPGGRSEVLSQHRERLLSALQTERLRRHRGWGVWGVVDAM